MAKKTKKKEKDEDVSTIVENSELSESRFYDSFFINEYGAIEVDRSQIHGAPFSVIIIHVESVDRERSEPTKSELLSFLRELVSSVNEVVRNCDVTGILEDRRIVIILPNTDYFGSLITSKKLSTSLEPLTDESGPGASIILSHASFPKDANSFEDLVGMATRRISLRLESLWHTIELKDKLFWEILATLTGASKTMQDCATFDIGSDYGIDNNLIQRINEGIIQEISRTPEKKGILYIGVKEVTNELPIKKPLSYISKSATNIFLVGEGKDDNSELSTAGPKIDIKNATVLNLNDPRIAGVYFTFFMNEDSAYALICKENWGDTHNCFHTSDPYLVEGLITKFQREYELQERL